MVLACVSLMMNDVEQMSFHVSFDHLMAVWAKCLFRSSGHFFFHVYLFEREGEQGHGWGEREREKEEREERENPKQALHCQHRAPHWGSVSQ